MIEEPENGIAPGQLRRVFNLFEEWAPSSQFIFTSHSPSFIDMFDYRRSNVTVLKKATDHTDILSAKAPPIAVDGDDKLTLSMEYASELLE
jgi:predicted ATPase